MCIVHMYIYMYPQMHVLLHYALVNPLYWHLLLKTDGINMLRCFALYYCTFHCQDNLYIQPDVT